MKLSLFLSFFIALKLSFACDKSFDTQPYSTLIHDKIQFIASSLKASAVEDKIFSNDDILSLKLNGDEYKVTALLGGGSDGVVVEAKRMSDQKHFAVKFYQRPKSMKGDIMAMKVLKDKEDIAKLILLPIFLSENEGFAIFEKCTPIKDCEFESLDPQIKTQKQFLDTRINYLLAQLDYCLSDVKLDNYVWNEDRLQRIDLGTFCITEPREKQRALEALSLVLPSLSKQAQEYKELMGDHWYEEELAFWQKMKTNSSK